jgi:hypothetical protein
MDFVAEHLNRLLRRLNSADVDEIEDVACYFLGSSFSNARGQLVMIPEKVQDARNTIRSHVEEAAKSYRGWRLDCGIQESVHLQSETLDVEK